MLLEDGRPNASLLRRVECVLLFGLESDSSVRDPSQQRSPALRSSADGRNVTLGFKAGAGGLGMQR